MIKDRIWTLVSRKLSGEATALELAELSQIIESQAHNDLYLQAIDEYWATPAEKDEEFLEATYHLHLKRLKEKGFDLEGERDDIRPLYLDGNEGRPRRQFNKIFFSASGIVIAVAVISFIFYSYNTRRSLSPASEIKMAQSEVATKSGSRTRIQLPDGSLVWLNGGSKLIYDNKNFGEKLRQVTLSGEAYFDVVKNVNKPFIIHTNKMDIKVLGTAFNVKAYPEETTSEATLIRGSIEVTLTSSAAKKIMLRPSEKIIVSSGVETVKADLKKAGDDAPKSEELLPLISVVQVAVDTKENIFKEIGWTQNKLMFKNESLSSIIATMQRWYGCNIEIRSKKLMDLKFTGSFKEESVMQVLEALQLSYNFEFKKENNLIIIY
ncbi:MAG: FecR family protein [Ferruginibacter sp.]